MISEDEARAMIRARLEHRGQAECQIIFLSCEALTPEQAKRRYGGKFIGVGINAIAEAVEVQYAVRIRADDHPPIWRDWEMRRYLVVLFVSSPLLLE